jgi:two-component system, NtrC family, nitrogen regulation sensor histidine kinase GlnL
MSATAPALAFAPIAEFDTGAGVDTGQLLQSLAMSILAIDRENRIRFANAAAAQFLGVASIGRPLADFIPADCPLFSLLDQARAEGSSIADREMTIEGSSLGRRLVAVDMAPLAERPGWMTIALQERSIAGRLDEALNRQGAARTMGTLAAVLAHEVKNPLSGVRGAAQLLEPGLDESGRDLTRLICEEVDRIVALVDRMEMFADERSLDRAPVNIHRALDHVRRIAETGFGRRRRFICDYDPSLPSVLGNRDLLIQLLLNLVKNAAEATPEEGGVITLTTRYQLGLRLAGPDGGRRHLPLMIGVQDNGPGIDEALRPRLFDPFASGKPGGKGLGLALVAKIVADHGGLIEVASEPRRTQFRILLPMATTEEGT